MSRRPETHVGVLSEARTRFSGERASGSATRRPTFLARPWPSWLSQLHCPCTRAFRASVTTSTSGGFKQQIVTSQMRKPTQHRGQGLAPSASCWGPSCHPRPASSWFADAGLPLPPSLRPRPVLGKGLLPPYQDTVPGRWAPQVVGPHLNLTKMTKALSPSNKLHSGLQHLLWEHTQPRALHDGLI